MDVDITSLQQGNAHGLYKIGIRSHPNEIELQILIGTALPVKPPAIAPASRNGIRRPGDGDGGATSEQFLLDQVVMFARIALRKGIYQVISVISGIPVLGKTYLALNDQRADDQDDSKAELKHHQDLTGCHQGCVILKSAF